MINRQFCRIRNIGLFLFLALVCLPVVGNAQTASTRSSDADETVANYNFKKARLRNVLSTIGRVLKLEVTFDAAVENPEINFERERASHKTVFNFFLESHKLQARAVEGRKIIVFPDTEENRERFASYKNWVTALEQ